MYVNRLSIVLIIVCIVGDESLLEKQLEETVELDDEIIEIIRKDPEVKKEELCLYIFIYIFSLERLAQVGPV